MPSATATQSEQYSRVSAEPANNALRVFRRGSTPERQSTAGLKAGRYAPLFRQREQDHAIVVLIRNHGNVRDIVHVNRKLGHAADPQGLPRLEILDIH